MTRKKGMPGNSQLLLGIIVVTMLIAAVHLGIFSFRETEDSHCWNTVSEYFLGREEIFHVSPHCLLNPLIPAASALLSRVLGISISASYLPLNLAALVGSGILLYRIGTSLINGKIAIVAALLFLIDFHTQYYGFAVVPDAVTWFFELLLIHLAQRVWKEARLSIKSIGFQGFIAGLAVLVKMNLVFLLPLIPIGLFRRGGMRNYRLIVIYGMVALLLPALFYSFEYSHVGILPWGSLASGLMERSPSLPDHITAFVSAFLYTIPLMVVGLTGISFKSHEKSFILATAGALVTPIFLWPYVMSRFSFSLFPLLLPLAAIGLWRAAEWITPSRRGRQAVLGALLVGLLVLGMLRMKLTFSHQTHLEFVLERATFIVR